MAPSATKRRLRRWRTAQRRSLAARRDEQVWLLEHPALYTAGTSARPQELIEARFPVFTAGRGGQFTYHGPGQRIGYMMLDLRRRAPDVRRFVATIEEMIIRTLAKFGVRGERRGDRIGVWVRRPERGDGAEDKIAAIGVRIQRWVTLHGFSLNVSPDLSHFSGIVPCGVSDPRFGVTSLADLGVDAKIADVDDALRAEFETLFGATAGGQRASQHREQLARPAQRQIRSAGFALIDALDARERRAVAAQLDHGENDFLRTGEERFHRTVAAVSHPALNAKLERGHHRPGAEAYPLHPAADHHPEDHVHRNTLTLRKSALPGRFGNQCLSKTMYAGGNLHSSAAAITTSI